MSAYTDVIGHASMVFDHVRNAAYERAILEKVTPESVVLDLGAGLGLHGLMAARAGAKKVFLVDPSPAVWAAEKVAQANGFDNVVCIQSSAENLELDEKVDLIISVFTGNFLLTEDLLPSLFVARDRFLKQGGQLIPEAGRMMLQAVSMADYHQKSVSRWSDDSPDSLKEKFGIDYSAIRAYAENNLHYDSFSEEMFEEISAEQLLTEIDFNKAKKAQSFDQVHCLAERSSDFHGWLCWFDMLLGDQWLSTSPKAEKLHWSQVFLPLPSAAKVQTGDALTLEMKRPEYGDWSWLSTPGSQKNQSTFLSRPVRAEDIQKQSTVFKPHLSRDGELIKFVLASFDGSNSIHEIAEQLVKRFPKKFSNQEKAIRYVQLQAKAFSQ